MPPNLEDLMVEFLGDSYDSYSFDVEDSFPASVSSVGLAVEFWT